ncbi:Demethylmenaquinone methyltransferase [bacterium HR32]|nr:Demethylmenaquinone methyltransferase [bacterium HR32]
MATQRGQEQDVHRAFARYWDQRAQDYDLEPQHVFCSEEERGFWVGLLGELCRGRPSVVLDVGTGTGFLALMLAELGHAVTGVDLSTRMLDQARIKADRQGVRLDLREAPAERTGLPAGTFDLVISRHVLWNVLDPALALQEWVRVTRPGGLVVAIDGCFQPAPDRWRDFREAFEALPFVGGVPPEVSLRFFEQAGLKACTYRWLDELRDLRARALPPEVAEPLAGHRYYLVRGAKPALAEAAP